MDKRAEAGALGFGLLDDGFNLGAISKLDTGPGAIGGHVFSEAFHDLVLLIKQQLLEIINARELAAIGQFAARIHRQAFLVLPDVLPVELTLGVLAFFLAAVVRAPSADNIKALQRKPRWVHDAVAARAGLQIPMLGELLADGAAATRVGLHGAHIRRRWQRRLAKQVFHHP